MKADLSQRGAKIGGPGDALTGGNNITLRKLYVYSLVIGCLAGLTFSVAYHWLRTVLVFSFDHVYRFELTPVPMPVLVLKQASDLEAQANILGVMKALIEHGLQDALFGALVGVVLLTIGRLGWKLLIVGPYDGSDRQGNT